MSRSLHAPMRLVVILIAATFGMLAIFPAATAIAATPSAGVSITAATGSSTDPAGGWFRGEVEPGASWTEEVVVRNTGDHPAAVRLAAVDAFSASTGGVQYGLGDESPAATGAWIELTKDRFVLAPSQETSIAFTVSVPSSASPGQHLAGLAAWVEQDAAEGENSAGFGAHLQVTTRQVMAVQVDVPGETQAALSVGDVTVAASPAGVHLDVEITNTGNELTKGSGSVWVDDELLIEDFPIDTLVPGTTVQYPVHWSASVPAGRHDIEVRLAYTGGDDAWHGQVQVGEEVIEELRDRSVTPLVVEGVRPWRELALIPLAALAMVIAGVVVATRRRSSQSVPEGGQHQADNHPVYVDH